MKFNKKDIKETHKLINMKSKEVKEADIETREKRVNIMQNIALIMLIIGCIMAILGAKFMDNIFKSYKMIQQSPLYNGIYHQNDKNDSLEDVQTVMNEVANLYENCYIGEIENENIDEYVINALIQAYGDKYATYRNSEETIANYNTLGNIVCGIGIYNRGEIDEDTDELCLYLIDVYEGGPAYEAGMQPGDKIVAVNGKRLSSSKYNVTEAHNDIRGEAGTSVEITFQDKSNNYVEKTVTLVRANANTVSLRYSILNDEYGYIEIRSFELNTDNELADALAFFSKKGINKYIFDLRNNGGGVAETCTNMLDTLLPEGLIANLYDTNGNITQTEVSNIDCYNFTSVCLMNEATASASELFIKALKDYDRTITIGETTFGKGTICTTYNLSNGGSVTLSTGKYVTKSGDDIEKIGIKPDIEMKLPDDKEKIVYKIDKYDDDLIIKAMEVLQ